MSTTTDSRPPTNGEQSSADQASGFTAVNGRSPSGGEESRHTNGHQSSSPELHRRDSVDSTGKRKHSDSEEHSPMSDTSHSSNPNKRQRSPGKAHSDNFVSMMNGTHDGGPHQPSQNDQYAETREESWGNPVQQSYNSDAQFAEALQRGTQEISQDANSHNGTSPAQRYVDHPHAHLGMNPVPAPGSITPAMAAPMIAKQRKRNFSNRTKTGCLTCRERKKKCDEGKPRCNNCDRGGFLCKGYAQNGGLYKPPSMNHPAPIQAKNGYYEPAQPPHYPYQPRPVHNAPELYETSPVAPGRSAPLGQESERETRAIPHPDPTLRNGNGYPAPAWQDNNRRPFPSEPGLHRPEYNHLPQFSMNSRDSNAKLPPPPPLQPPLPRQNSHPMDAQGVAQLALQQQQQPPPPAQSRGSVVHQSEKEKMLNGINFNHQDKQLKDERRNCKLALHKFNQNVMDTESERSQKLREVLEPRRRSSASPNTNGLKGHLGEHVEVESPFYCQYGYNIELGDEVEIGANVTIIDSAKVVIGPRTVIEPGVTIDTQIPELDPTPQGVKRLRKAKPIFIQADVYIGANAVIRPHSRLGDSLTIQHGVNILAGCVVSDVVTLQNNLNWEHPPPNAQSSMRSRRGS